MAGEPPIVEIVASPPAIVLGQSATLNWSSSGARTCEASGAWSGPVDVSGSRSVTPGATGISTYAITCDGLSDEVALRVTADASSLPTAVTVSLSQPSVPIGQGSTLTWSSTNATSCAASGAWNGSRSANGDLVVAQAAAGAYSYILTCSGPGGTATGSAMLGVTGESDNVTTITVDRGPASIADTVGIINAPFVNVTLCRPGTSICQTIDHVLLDTGSYGLRIIAPGVLDSALTLPAVTTSAGGLVGECAQFASGFMWGAVRRADVRIAGELASSLPVHQVGDGDGAFARIPSSCSNTGANLGTVARLGANGILGVGFFRHDCGSACETTAIPGTYYQCDVASGCTSIAMPVHDQVANPVAAFRTNNNGVSLIMPAVASAGATSVKGMLVFGIDTQANNGTGTATVFTVDRRGHFTTSYNGTVFGSSFLDSGSNGLFFADTAIPLCAGGFDGFYCPAEPFALSAVNTAADGTTSGTVSVTIMNPQALDAAVRAATLGGSTGFSGFLSRSFDWGMPFFFGRNVFVAIEGASTQRGQGPYWAY